MGKLSIVVTTYFKGPTLFFGQKMGIVKKTIYKKPLLISENRNENRGLGKKLI
jgi:hypothetical protein